jgi:hypothetical protein
MTANIIPLASGILATVALILGALFLAPAPVAEYVDPYEEPLFSSGAHTLLWNDAFDEAPKAPMTGRAETLSRYGPYVTLDASALQFDPASGVDGSGALQIRWSAAAPSAGCADDSQLLEASFAPAREIVVQYSVRYTPGFVFDWTGHEPCSGNAKKLFLLWAREGSRFVFINENGVLGIGSDHDHPLFAQNRAVGVTPRELADGRWHRITFRVRQGSSPDAADGSVHGWIDGVQRWSYDGIVTHNAGGYYLFKMPATFNSGSPVAQSEWLDALRVWRSQ